MFTGIIEYVGRLESLDLGEEGRRLRVHAGPLAAGLAVSASIAVNGCCLTVVELAGEVFSADLSAETLRCTTFGKMKPGAVFINASRGAVVDTGVVNFAARISSQGQF